MSCERRVHTFQQVEEVRIECCNKKELEDLEKTIITSLEQKLEKLNILIKNCNVFSGNGMVLVNDRYNICSDLITVAEAFGLNIKQIQCSLRGKNYIITDDLLTVLKQLEKEYEFGKNIAKQELSDIVSQILSDNSITRNIDANVLDMVRNIKKNGQYVTTRTRTITEETEDGRLIGRSEGQWVSNADEIRNRLMDISKKAQNTVNRTNSQLRDGTAKLIYARARQMGYAVQEVKKGTQTQLVLVRCE
jgi:seryl-tRNA synthetase